MYKLDTSTLKARVLTVFIRFFISLLEMLNAILANWTAQLSQHMYSLPSGEPRATHTIVTEDDIVKPTTETELDVIEVDSVEPATQGNLIRGFPSPSVAHAQ